MLGVVAAYLLGPKAEFWIVLISGLGLLVLPVLTTIGFGALALWPSFAMLAIVQVLRDAGCGVGVGAENLHPADCAGRVERTA